MSSALTLVAGRYRLLRQLGAGGMGRVWLAQDEMLGRQIAIKEVVIPDGLSAGERGELRFRTLREARTAARLNHPNVVKIYDVVHTEEQPWIVMEYVPSRSLHEVISESGPVPPAEAARIGLAMLDALTAAHRAGVLHRDVKPGNVLLARDGRVVLTDFGLATFDGGDSALTLPGLVFGSVRYVAPERARDGTSTPQSDLWALGATLYAAVEGQSPYARSSAMQTLTALATATPDPPKRAGALKPVLIGLLRRNPRDRLRPDEARRLLERVGPTDRSGVRGRFLPRPRRGYVSGSSGSTTPLLPVDPTKAPTVTLEPLDRRPQTSTDELLATPPAARPFGARRLVLVTALCTVVILSALGALVGTANTHRSTPQVAASPSAGPPDPVLGDGSCPATGATELRPASRKPNWDTLPAGWIWYADTSGYRIAVPGGWLAYSGPEGLCFREPGEGRWVGVTTWPANSDPLSHVAQRERSVLGMTPASARYQQVRLEAVDYYQGGADWEFTFTEPYGVRMHGDARDFLVGTGRGYTIVWCTRDLDWQPNLDNWRLVMASFTPM